MDSNTGPEIELSQGKKEQNFIYFLLVCLLGLVIIGESLMIIKLLSQKTINTPPAEVVSTVTPTSAPTNQTTGTMVMKLVGSSEVVVGKDLKALLVIDSYQTAVAGVDAIISFDPKLISVKTVTQNGDLFPTFMVNKQQEKQGRIKITAINSASPFKGMVELASIDFVLLKNSSAEVGIEFRGVGNTADSNLISAANQTDILSKVTPLVVEPELSR